MSGIRVEGASKRFAGVQALAGVNLVAAPGEFVVILGPSGSGKTTLLRALAGLEPLDAGRIVLGDTLVEDAARGLRLPPERRGLGMVFQEYALWPHLSTLENVALPLRERRDRDWRAHGEEALARVGLTAHAARFPYELSGGQQQRVALARALAARPQLLLFDEPLSNLDAQLRDELRLEIARLTREHGITAVYITHDQAEAFFLADRLGVMHSGQLVQFAPPEEVYRAPANEFVAHFTGAQGQLAGQVVGGELRCGPLTLALPSPPPDGPVRLTLRPDAVTVHPTPQPQTLAATVLHSAYSGGRYQCWLDTPDGQRLQAIVGERLNGGQPVWLGLDPERLLVFPDRAAVTASGGT